MPIKGCPFPGSKELFEVCRAIADRARPGEQRRVNPADVLEQRCERQQAQMALDTERRRRTSK